jgi:hypothetical protein
VTYSATVYQEDRIGVELESWAGTGVEACTEAEAEVGVGTVVGVDIVADIVVGVGTVVGAGVEAGAGTEVEVEVYIAIGTGRGTQGGCTEEEAGTGVEERPAGWWVPVEGFHLRWLGIRVCQPCSSQCVFGLLGLRKSNYHDGYHQRHFLL